MSVSCSGSRKRGSWFRTLPRGQRLDLVTSQGAFQLHGTFSMPWPTILWLNAFSHFWSRLRVYLLGKTYFEPQPWPGEGSTLEVPRRPCPFHHRVFSSWVRPWNRIAWVRVLALSLSSSVTLGKSLKLYVPPFLLL